MIRYTLIYCIELVFCVTLLHFVYITTNVAPLLDCGVEFNAAEQCFSLLMIGAEKITWTKENIKNICSSKFEAIDCLQNYRKKCVSGMTSMIFSMMTKKFNATFNFLCSNETALDELLYHFECLKNSLFTDNVKKCAIQSQLKLEMIDKYGLDSKIPIICCSFIGLKHCMQNNLKSECDLTNSNASINYMNGLVNKFTGDLGRMFCMDYKTFETCSEKMHPDTYNDLIEINTYDYKTAKSKIKFSSYLRLIKHLIEQPIA